MESGQGWYATSRLVGAGYVQLTAVEDLWLTYKGLQLVCMLDEDMEPSSVRPSQRRVSGKIYVDIHGAETYSVRLLWFQVLKNNEDVVDLSRY